MFIMKKIYPLLLVCYLFAITQIYSQGTFCNPSGNVAIFSNYDGGILPINVDMNIPNLKIGITGYENDSIIISGSYVGNVTQVIFAGYFNSANVHCNPWPSVKSINGVPASIVQINFLPPVTYNNPYGYSTVICNYSCSTNTSQGGCNTPDQVAGYFFNQFGSTALLFHFTQYGCWSGAYNLTDGGNCCAVPPNVGIHENILDGSFSVSPNPAKDYFELRISSRDFGIGLNKKYELKIVDMPGKEVLKSTIYPNISGKYLIDISQLKQGIYFVELKTEKGSAVKKVVLL